MTPFNFYSHSRSTRMWDVDLDCGRYSKLARGVTNMSKTEGIEILYPRGADDA